MLGNRLKAFAQAGIDHTEGRLALAEDTLKQAGKASAVHLPTVSSSTGAAMTAIIRPDK